MTRILLINPNTSSATTRMMVNITQAAFPSRCTLQGSTATRGVSMITTQAELEASVEQVQAAWAQAGSAWDGVIVACFGDPGVEWLREHTAVPVVGICEASMLDAAHAGLRFGVATTTPDLRDAIHARARALGLATHYTGLRATEGDAQALVGDPVALKKAMRNAITACVNHDGAEAVIIGGGPLGQVAMELADSATVPLIAPLVSAARLLQRRMLASSQATH